MIMVNLTVPFVLRGGSRIRTLEGISRRIYRPLPCGGDDIHDAQLGPGTPVVLSTCCKEGSRNGQLRSTKEQVKRRSACITWHGSEIPKLPSKGRIIRVLVHWFLRWSVVWRT